jgi:hypothetical protein
MTKVANFWRNHRLGMFYGFLWYLAMTAFFSLWSANKYLFEAAQIVLTLACCLVIGMIVTALFRKWLKGKRNFFPWALLSQAIGAALFGLFLPQAQLLLSQRLLFDGPVEKHLTMNDWLATLTMALTFPFCSFLSIFVVIFLPLSCLNTWHLWKKVNRPDIAHDEQASAA